MKKIKTLFLSFLLALVLVVSAGCSEKKSKKDDVDLLVDEIVETYATTTLKSSLAASVTYSDSTYWQIQGIKVMIDAKASKKVYNYDMLTDTYKDSVKNQDTTTLQGAAFAKYYYAARAIGQSTDSFKSAYTTYLEGKTEYSSYGEYELSFTLPIAKSLKLNDKVNTNVINTTYRSSTAWGTDGLAWQLTGLAAYKDVSSELSAFTLASLESAYSVDVSLSAMILPYAASNLSARNASFDIVAELLKHYDKDAKKFETEKLGSGDYSSNQIYAALMAYKAQRDTKKAVNLFA